ncbi:lipocalin-like domain protein [Pandoraea captiosa]|uniref:Lipocalin-like domain protein n=1 Tax=Pandoraea captiosa TaxID=2508302 RepID=A0A5E5AM35_9BURK|nr:lipocalin-like domain-containing protein [Pandoraea captiosa]VVE74484.1 lipocalin-like domain protein [Pandoraea captiosa]
MKAQTVCQWSAIGAMLVACGLTANAAQADVKTDQRALAGTWTLVAADVQHPDGSRARDYGADPKGMLVIDAQGHYSLQIFKSERVKFASGDKAVASAEEYKAAVIGSSTHFGTLNVDAAAGTLSFHIRSASFPNWEGQTQTRHFELNGDVLSYRVTPRPNGDVPISIWKRVDDHAR